MEDKTWEEFKQTLIDYPDGVYHMVKSKDKELSELRAWKTKARPFLEQQVATLTSVIPGAKNLNSDAKTDVICLIEKKLNELTELLGGGDE